MSLYSWMNIKKYRVRFADGKRFTIYESDLSRALTTAYRKHFEKFGTPTEHIEIRRI